jgi:single-strand DNA-binding protein
MSYELTGKIKLFMDQQTFSSGFTKREFVVTTEGEYPQDIKLECVKDNVAKLSKFTEGDRVLVSFDVRGNEYKDRYYVNLVAWKIAHFGGEAAAPAPKQADAYTQPADTDEDMPF